MTEQTRWQTAAGGLRSGMILTFPLGRVLCLIVVCNRCLERAELGLDAQSEWECACNRRWRLTDMDGPVRLEVRGGR
jgi:hypothetical protein